MALSEQVEQHVSEEENLIFGKARDAGIDLEALGLRIKERKEAMQDGFHVAPGADAGGDDQRATP
jgi:hypothetical protein